MAKFPEPPPPAKLARIAPAWKVLAAGTWIWRIYFRAGPHPTTWNALRWYGPTTGRFDHHLDPPGVQTRGILYAALDAQGCIAEVFQEKRRIDRHAREPWLVGFEVATELSLLDLTGTWPTRAGASTLLCSGMRDRARRWSRSIHAAYPTAQGLYYPSSMNASKPLVAVYERGQAALPARPLFHRALADPVMLTALRNAAIDLGYRML